MKSQHKNLILVSLLALLLFSSGCGLVQYTSVILDATAVIESAKEEKAWKYACFDYYAAVRYSKKAMEEAGYSDYEAATDLARKALNHARAAVNASKRQTPAVVTCKIPKAMKQKYTPQKKKN